MMSGDHRENMLALWSTETYTLLVATTTSCGLMLDICWEPHIAYECVSCGCGPSLCFWLLEETSKDHVTLNVCKSISVVVYTAQYTDRYMRLKYLLLLKMEGRQNLPVSAILQSHDYLLVPTLVRYFVNIHVIAIPTPRACNTVGH